MATELPTVDVLIPSRRGGPSLERALASVEAVRAAEPGVQIAVHVEEDPDGTGPAATRNRAARRGRGEYLALLDDDDRWLSPRLIDAVRILGKKPEIAIVCGDATLASGGTFLANPPPSGGEGRDHGSLALGWSVCTSTATLRRADWEAAGGMDERLTRAEDYDLWLRLTAEGRRVHVLPHALAWRADGGGLSADPVAMAAATLEALARSARMPEGERAFGKYTRMTEGVRAWRDRRGRLRGVVAHGLAKNGEFGEALGLAIEAVSEAPTARVAWTSLVRATLRLRRPA
jgi:hypothetical protein